MAEKSEVISSIMKTTVFRERVRGIVAGKADTILAQGTPDANELTWAKAAVQSGYDAWTEALLILVDTSPVSVAAAMAAGDTAYNTAMDNVFAKAVKAKT